MGIRFICPACTKRINVKDHQAGKRGLCPKCGASVQIPLTSTLTDRPEAEDSPTATIANPAVAAQPSAAPSPAEGTAPVGRIVAIQPAPAVDPLAENPTAVWYVSAADGGQPFGPADGATMFQWLQEGRIASTSLVWRQDWPEWQPATSLWPHLAGAASAPPSQVPAPPVPADGSGAVSPSGGRAPVGSSPPAAAIYYQRRSNGAYLATVVVLVLLVAALAWVTYYVISRGPNRADEDTSRITAEMQTL